jgi:hypothetical protein
MTKKTCAVCGSEFNAKGTAKTCSVSHSIILKKDRNRQWRSENLDRVRGISLASRRKRRFRRQLIEGLEQLEQLKRKFGKE